MYSDRARISEDKYTSNSVRNMENPELGFFEIFRSLKLFKKTLSKCASFFIVKFKIMFLNDEEIDIHLN